MAVSFNINQFNIKLSARHAGDSLLVGCLDREKLQPIAAQIDNVHELKSLDRMSERSEYYNNMPSSIVESGCVQARGHSYPQSTQPTRQ